MNHLYLSGYRGSGKSSVGRIVAKRLDRLFEDVDDLIERTADESIQEIFRNGGEQRFRDLEEVALADATARPARVIALGGGAVLRAENRRLIRENGQCVCLDASPEVLAKRLQDDASTAARRPSLTGGSVIDEIADVLRAREAVYADSADHRIDTDGLTPVEVAETIVAWWRSVVDMD